MYYNANDGLRNNMNQSKNLQKNKNIFQPNIKLFQSPSQQYQNLMYNNNNINFINYNIKVNKVKNPQKEKIIEGDLNFNNKKVYHNKIPNNNSKHKKYRNKPTKSPVPVPKDYKPSNFQYKKLLHNNYYMQNSNVLKPKSAFPRKNNFNNNANNANNVNNANNNNKNVIKPNILGINSNFPSNKTYNAFNIFKKNLERTHSPLLRASGANNGINFVQKGPVKSRYSKSPILSKGSIFNRYKMYGFGVNSNSTSTSSISNNQKNKKKTPIKNNQKKIATHPKQNINYNINNINNLRNKGPTLISGELIQDSSSNGKFNINNMNKSNNQNINQMNNNIGNKKINNNDFVNIKPVYNPEKLKIESNNALLNINAESNKDKEIQKKKII